MLHAVLTTVRFLLFSSVMGSLNIVIGNRVWANPRAVIAMMRQCNTVDMTRRSPSYEVRLAKYAGRFYEVYTPALEREKIDPTVRLHHGYLFFPSQSELKWVDLRTQHSQDQRASTPSRPRDVER